MFKYEIGHKLKMARKKANLNQEDVAKIIGSTFQKISSFETGRTRVDLETLIRLCNIYNVDPDYILSTNKQNQDDLHLTQQEYDIIIKFRTLPNILKEDIIDYIIMKYNKFTNPSINNNEYL